MLFKRRPKWPELQLTERQRAAMAAAPKRKAKKLQAKLILIGVAAVWIGRRLMTDQQFGRDLVHNVIIHPCLMLLPAHLAHELHDRNADWAFSQNRVDELGAEQAIAKAKGETK